MKRLTNSGTREAKSDVTIREVLNKLAEYEDLEEKGMLLKLPCETVWFITDNHSKYATVWGKPIKALSMHEIEGIDKKGHYYSTEEKAQEMLEKS